MLRKCKPGMEVREVKSIVKGLGLNDFGGNGNASVIDVQNGRVVRIRPLHYD